MKLNHYPLRALACIIFAAFPYLVSGQTATTFQNAIKNHSITIEHLDSIYLSALHSDTTKAVFNGHEKEFQQGYVSLLQDLGKHLKANGFEWDKKTKCFNRIYFNSDGKIDYFLFNFFPGEIDPEKEKQFEELLNSFVPDYQFPLKADKNFAQCSPVTYQPGTK